MVCYYTRFHSALWVLVFCIPVLFISSSFKRGKKKDYMNSPWNYKKSWTQQQQQKFMIKHAYCLFENLKV